MSETDETTVKKVSMVNLDKLINDFSQIEKRMSEISSKNNKLDIQLEKTNSLLKLMQTKENSIKEDENEQLKKNNDILKEKLKSHEQVRLNVTYEVNPKERKKKRLYFLIVLLKYPLIFVFLLVELNEEKHKELMEKKEMEISELTTKLRTQDMEKQNEIIKLQIELNAQLARAQMKSAKAYSDSTVLPQNIYRRKLQHLQEEKNKEIAILRDTIRDLEHRLTMNKDSRLKRKRP
uniref:Coiled-coil domain containing 152 n=1 Tax=Vombatus ursinus TaxID=29139 RepID=A0A4X2JT35_VOMUR